MYMLQYRHLLRVDAVGGNMANRHTSVLSTARTRRSGGVGDGAGAGELLDQHSLGSTTKPRCDQRLAAEREARSRKNRVRRLGAQAGGEAPGLDDRGGCIL